MTVATTSDTLVDPFQNLEQIIPPCPLCDSRDHQRCRFQAGSLYCITHNCANPHHRSQA